MTAANKQSLERFRNHYNAWVKDACLYSMDGGENDVLRIIREEWDPGHHVDLWCGSCRAKMLVYAFERMDKEATQAAPPMKTTVIKIKINNPAE